MTRPAGRTPNHLANDLLIRAMDDELSPLETARVETHLEACAECKLRYQAMRVLSDRVETLAATVVPPSSAHSRQLLADRLAQQEAQHATAPGRKFLYRFSWAMGLAATLALGIFFAPRGTRSADPAALVSSAHRAADTFEVNGETFVALPYSNPDLPVSSSHVVQMQVPVSSLTDAGVSFEPVSAQQTAFDHSVLTDVLIGMDGQPLGFHVLTAE